MQQARVYLTEQRDQAVKDLDLLPKPYTSPSGITFICPESKLEEWRAECRKSLEIAERVWISA